MDDLAWLRLQVEWGADEALSEAPIDRTVAPTDRIAATDRMAGRDTAAGLGNRDVPAVVPASGLALAPPSAVAPLLVARAEAAAAAADTLDALRAALAGFDGCDVAATATHLVFDETPDARLLVVGEAPGAEEDRVGLPYVGPAGTFLRRALQSTGIEPRHVAIAMLVPWRPPGNRPPNESEIQICKPFLLRYVTLVRPRVLVLVGGVVTRALTGNSTPVRRLRGRWIDLQVPGLVHSIHAMPVITPETIMRTGTAKRELWSDLLAVHEVLASP